ncbi:type II secretion system protein [Ideonella sp. A 288]|uniref:type II secretion system protein n=1 Tax=Ideonella sp. A 288 TaxID=1962181 RepID=UPI003855D300
MRHGTLANRPAARRVPRGFTVIELVLVIVLLGILAVVALPRMGGALSARGEGWRSQVLSALREAHGVAQAHRRLVCATVATGDVTLQIATTHPAAACSQPWLGPDRDTRSAHHDQAPATVLSPAGTLYFQPSGRITSDAAGTTAVSASVRITGEADITLVGDTGHVD